MRALRRFLRRVVSLATRRAQDEQTAENVRAGLSPVEARRHKLRRINKWTMKLTKISNGNAVAASGQIGTHGAAPPSGKVNSKGWRSRISVSPRTLEKAT